MCAREAKTSIQTVKRNVIVFKCSSYNNNMFVLVCSKTYSVKDLLTGKIVSLLHEKSRCVAFGKAACHWWNTKITLLNG